MSRGRHVGLGLVVVVVGDEVLDRVVREELAELAVELRGERLVVRQHHGGALHALDHVGDGEGLARSGDAEQRLVRQALAQALDELLDRLRLIARGLVVGFEFEGNRVSMRDECSASASIGPGSWPRRSQSLNIARVRFQANSQEFQ